MKKKRLRVYLLVNKGLDYRTMARRGGEGRRVPGDTALV